METKANEQRIKEANDCIQKARDHLKTSLLKLKTKPDYDSAAYEYERAAVCFRNAGRLDLCRDAHLETARCYNYTKNLFHEAKAKESAAMACKDSQDFGEANRLFTESVDDYFASGSIVTAAQTLDKAAKLLTPVMPEKALKLYEHGLSFTSHDEATRTVIGFFERSIGLSLKLGQFDKALRISRDLIEKFCEMGEPNKIGKVVLGMSLIELKLDDPVAALNCIQQMPASIVSMFAADIGALKRLVVAYEAGDDIAFQACLRESVWSSMDNDFLRFAKTLKALDRSKSNVTGAGVVEEDDGIC